MKKYLLPLLFILPTGFLFAQDSIVKDEDLPEAEFHVAMNPLDSNTIILGTIHGFGTNGPGNIRVHYSHDFGDSWSTSTFTGEHEGYDGAGDPVLAFDTAGHAFLTNLSLSNGEEVNTVLSKSVDGGETWTLAAEVATGFTDKPWIAIDRNENSPYLGNIYLPIVENEVSLYRLDGNAQALSTVAIPNGDALPSVVVKSNGDVFTSTVSLGVENKVFVQHFNEGGANLLQETEVVSFPDYTFNAPWISNRFQPTAYLAIDNSGGEYEGRLYLSYTASEEADPDYFDVMLTYSDDNGTTWSAPHVVHNDDLANVQQFYSSIYVNEQGVVIMDWYDQRNHDDESKLTDFYMGISHDGGETFTEIQLNSVASDFDNVIPSSNGFGIGEYHQVVATAHTAISFWSDGRTNDGDLNIYMAKVNLEGELIGVDEISTLSSKIKVGALYPLPANDEINIDFSITEKMNIKGELIDNQGKIYWSSDLVTYPVGKHSLNIPCKVPAGTYYVRLSSAKGYFKSVKMMKH